MRSPDAIAELGEAGDINKLFAGVQGHLYSDECTPPTV
jgi:hypothetical protein